MKGPADSTRSIRDWLVPTLVMSVSGFTGHSAGHHREDPAYCLQEPDDHENADSWDRFIGLPAQDEPWFAAQRLRPGEPAAEVGGVAAMSPAGYGSGQGAHALAAEVATLKAELAQVRDDRAAEQRDLRDLRERLQELERKFDDLLAMQDFDAEEVPDDPHAQWIKQNFNELHKYPDMFVALDPERGILVHATEQNEFTAKLETLTPEENERVTLFHTSMYLRG